MRLFAYDTRRGPGGNPFALARDPGFQICRREPGGRSTSGLYGRRNDFLRLVQNFRAAGVEIFNRPFRSRHGVGRFSRLSRPVIDPLPPVRFPATGSFNR